MSSAFWNDFLLACVVLYGLSAALPLWKTDRWWVRTLDFPRLQLAILGLLAGALKFAFFQSDPWEMIAVVTVVMVGIGLDAYRIVPYTPLVSREVEEPTAKKLDRRKTLKLMTSNVLQSNRGSERLAKVVERESPDLLLLVEVNERWVKAVEGSFRDRYPHQVLVPQENTYGMALYSRWPLRDFEVRFHIEDDVPSIFAVVVLPSGDEVEIHGIHPRPPRPANEFTTERDAELVKVAKITAKASRPAIVLGDLNDVAWSHTSRLFRRISGLLDPRVGRGPLPTFPTALPGWRFPLDHMFHSPDFRVSALKRLEDIGSDHFPLCAELYLEGVAAAAKEERNADLDDHREAERTLRRARSG